MDYYYGIPQAGIGTGIVPDSLPFLPQMQKDNKLD